MKIVKNKIVFRLVAAALIVSVSLNIVSYANHTQEKKLFMDQAYSNLQGVIFSLDSISGVSRADAESGMMQLIECCTRMDATLDSTAFVSSAHGFDEFERIAQWKIVYGEGNGYEWDEITDYAERWNERLMVLLQELSKNGELSYGESNVMLQNPDYFMNARNINRIFNVYFEEKEKEAYAELQSS